MVSSCECNPLVHHQLVNKSFRKVMLFVSVLQLCDLLKSRVECPDFLEKLESAQASVPQNMAGRDLKAVALRYS